MVSEFLHEYMHIVSDPAHMLAEVTFMILIDLIFLGLVVPFFKRAVSKAVDKRVLAEHAILDAEHGVTHPGSLPVSASDVAVPTHEGASA